MSSERTPSSEPDELLRAAALGELDRTRPEVAARLRGDPELARAVEELERTRAATERVLREGAQLLARARSDASPRDRALVHARLQDLSRGRARGPRRRGWFLALAGLAAALVIGLYLLRASSAGPAADHWLEQGGVSIRHLPAGAGPGELHWEVALHPGERLELSFYADRDGRPGELLLGPVPVEGQAWRPTDEQARVLTESWFVELDLLDAGDERRVLGRARCSSSR